VAAADTGAVPGPAAGRGDAGQDRDPGPARGLVPDEVLDPVRDEDQDQDQVPVQGQDQGGAPVRDPVECPDVG
jgi:hypothetical protein